MAPEDLQTHGADFEDDPADREAHRREWPPGWRHAAVDSASHLRLDLDEVAELREELVALLTGWAVRAEAREDDPDYRPVEVQISAFPNGPPPES